MSAGKAIVAFLIISGIALVAYRKLTGQPVIPRVFVTIGPVVPNDPVTEEQQRELGESAYDPLAGIPYLQPIVDERQAEGVRTAKRPTWIENLLGINQASEAPQDLAQASTLTAIDKAEGQPVTMPDEAIPAGLAIAAGGSAAAVQVLRSKAKGTQLSKVGYSQTKSGLVKWTTNPRTGAAVAETAKGASVPAKVGQGPVKVPSAVAKPPAITGANKIPAVTPKVPAVPAAAKVAARIAGKVLLPVGVALGAYDLASRAQSKGAENLDVGDVAAAISGVGGLGIRQHLPPAVQGALKTKAKDVLGIIQRAVFDAGKNVGKAVSSIAAKPPAPRISEAEKRKAALTVARNATKKKSASSTARAAAARRVRA